MANAVGGIKLGGGANAGSAAELSRAPAAKIRSGTRATHWAGVLVGPGLYKALKVNPPGRRATEALGDLRRGLAAGWRRRGASREEFPKKAELVPFPVHQFAPAIWWRSVSVRVVLGRERGAEVIGLIRLGTTQVSVLDPSPRWAQFLPQKGWVIERSCVPRQPGDPRAQSARVCKACLVVRRPSSMTSFLFRQD